MVVWFFEDEYEDDDEDEDFRCPHRTRPRLFSNTPSNLLMKDKQKTTLQLIWGVLLLLAGIGVFFRIPQIMPAIKKIEQFAPFIYFIYFCFYLLAVLLIAGGGRKLYTYFKHSNDESKLKD